MTKKPLENQLCQPYDEPIPSNCRSCSKPFYLYYPYCRIKNICRECEELAKNCEHYLGSGKWTPWLKKSKNTERQVKGEKRFNIFQRDGFRCVYCESRYNLQIDHIIPFSKSRDSSEGNLQSVCSSCNKAKGDL